MILLELHREISIPGALSLTCFFSLGCLGVPSSIVYFTAFCPI